MNINDLLVTHESLLFYYEAHCQYDSMARSEDLFPFEVSTIEYIKAAIINTARRNLSYISTNRVTIILIDPIDKYNLLSSLLHSTEEILDRVYNCFMDLVDDTISIEVLHDPIGNISSENKLDDFLSIMDGNLIDVIEHTDTPYYTIRSICLFNAAFLNELYSGLNNNLHKNKEALRDYMLENSSISNHSINLLSSSTKIPKLV